MTGGVTLFIVVTGVVLFGLFISKLVNASNPADRRRRSSGWQGGSYDSHVVMPFHGSGDAASHHHASESATTQPVDAGFDAPTTQPSDFSADAGGSSDAGGGGDCGGGGDGGGGGE